MPSLKYLECKVRAQHTKTPFAEHEIEYKDGLVSCYCLVPDSKVEICITLEAQEYIAPRLAVGVVIDGKYQANQTQRMFTVSPDGQYQDLHQIQFELNQKESFLPDGRIIASPWILYPLTGLTNDASLTDTQSVVAEKISTIEVIVLRCGPDDIIDTASPFEMMPSTRDRSTFGMMRSDWTSYGSSNWHAALGDINTGDQTFHAHPSSSLPNIGPSIQQGFARRTPLSPWVIDGAYALAYARQMKEIDPEQFEADIARFPNHVLEDIIGPARYSREIQTTKTDNTVNSDAPSQKIQERLQKIYNATSELPSQPSHAMVNGPAYGYVRDLAVPTYFDSKDKPYAKFVFRYLSRDALVKRPGIDIDFAYEDAVEEFQGKTKEQIIAELVAQRKASASHQYEPAENNPTWNDSGRDTSPDKKPDTWNDSGDAWNNSGSTAPQQDTSTDNKPDDTWNDQNNAWNDDSKDYPSKDSASRFNKYLQDPDAGTSPEKTELNSKSNQTSGQTSDIEAKISALGTPPARPNESMQNTDQEAYLIALGKMRRYDAEVARIRAGKSEAQKTEADAPDSTQDKTWSPEPNKTDAWSPEPQTSPVVESLGWSPLGDSTNDKQSEPSNDTLANSLTIYMVQIDQTLPTRNGDTTTTPSQTTPSPSAPAPTRRRARAESFYTTTRPTSLLNEDNTTPGYGTITPFERAMTQRDLRNAQLSAPTPAPTTTPPSLEEEDESLPPTPHLEAFPSFNPSIIPTPSHSPERGRHPLRRRRSRANFFISDSPPSDSTSSSRTIRPGARTPTQRDFLAVPSTSFSSRGASVGVSSGLVSSGVSSSDLSSVFSRFSIDGGNGNGSRSRARTLDVRAPRPRGQRLTRDNLARLERLERRAAAASEAAEESDDEGGDEG